MRYYAVEYKVRENNNNPTLDDYKRSEIELSRMPKNEVYEFEDYDLHKVYFKTKAEQLQFILNELNAWS